MTVRLYGYDDYRKYLRDWFADPEQRTSQRAFAKKAGCSPALVTRLLKGELSLDPTRCAAWSDALGLDPDEARYLAALVDLDSDSMVRRVSAHAVVRAVQQFSNAIRPGDELRDEESQWINGVLGELLMCGRVPDDPQWIAQQFEPPAPVEDVQRSIDVLVSIGRVVRNDGYLTTVTAQFASPQDVGEESGGRLLMNVHEETHARAARALRVTPANERHYSRMVFALPSARLPAVKRRLLELERELFAAIADSPGDPDRVFVLAIALFPGTVSLAEPDQ